MHRRLALPTPLVLTLACSPGPIAGAGADEAGESGGPASSETEAGGGGESGPAETSTTRETGPGETGTTETETETSETGAPAWECGNGIVDPNEQCDGEELDGFTCVDLGYITGELACKADSCTFDASDCSADLPPADGCHDGEIDEGELCDQLDFAGASCEDFGFVAGSLVCSWACDAAWTYACISAFDGPACELDDDCPRGWPLCVEGHCWDGSSGDLCADDSDCSPEAEHCGRGQCWSGDLNEPCDTIDDCAGMLRCNSLAKVCASGAMSMPCGVTDDCTPPAICLDGVCDGV